MPTREIEAGGKWSSVRHLSELQGGPAALRAAVALESDGTKHACMHVYSSDMSLSEKIN